MAWFEPDSGVVKDSIVKINDVYYKARRIVLARKLRSTQVQFIKVYLNKYGLIS